MRSIRLGDCDYALTYWRAADFALQPVGRRKDLAVKKPDLIDVECHASHQSEAKRPGKEADEVEVAEGFDPEAGREEFSLQIGPVIAPEMAEMRIQV